MKLILLFLAICCSISACYAYSFLIPAKMRMQGICMFNGMPLKLGDNNMPSACQNMHCNEDGSILVEGCGHHEIASCRIIDPLNLHKPYPECCKMNFMCSSAAAGAVHRQISPLDTGVYA